MSTPPIHAPMQGTVFRSCWACGASNRVPSFPFSGTTEAEETQREETVLPIFECEHCGALNEEDTLPSSSLALANGEGSQPSPWMSAFETSSIGGQRMIGLLSPTKAVAVVATLSVITFVWASCAFLLVPEVLGMRHAVLNLLVVFIGTLLHAFIVANYVKLSFGEPGSPIAHLRSVITSFGESRIPQGAFAGMQWCPSCRMAKPHGASHCRRCDRCVMVLDHHCVYTGNCVGKDNMELFIRFLKITCAGAWIAVIICILHGYLYIYIYRRNIWQRCIETRKNLNRVWFPLQLFLYSSLWLWAPWKLVAWEATLVLSLTGGIGTGILLHRQMKLLRMGTTYLEERKRVQPSWRSGSVRKSILRKRF